MNEDLLYEPQTIPSDKQREIGPLMDGIYLRIVQLQEEGCKTFISSTISEVSIKNQLLYDKFFISHDEKSIFFFSQEKKIQLSQYSI